MEIHSQVKFLSPPQDDGTDTELGLDGTDMFCRSGQYLQLVPFLHGNLEVRHIALQ